MNLVLDTHAALWLVQGDPRLPGNARSRIESTGREELLISDLLLLELSMLIHKKRVMIAGEPGPFLEHLAARFTVVAIDSEIAARAMSIMLPQGDPFDRIFIATALRHNAELVTRDRAIHGSALVPVIW